MLSRGFEIETEMTIHALQRNMQVENVIIDYRDRPEGSESKLNTYSDGFKVLGLSLIHILGSYDALSARLDEIAVDEVVVALEADEIELLPHVFAACDKNGVRITMVPFYSDYLPARPTIDVLDECKLINVRQTPFDNLLNAAVKRGLDIIGSLILIILTSPVMLVTAIGVKPVSYTHLDVYKRQR